MTKEREEAMAFPKTWEEYEQLHGFTDTDEIYTNGIRLIPSFRVKQWLEHQKLTYERGMANKELLEVAKKFYEIHKDCVINDIPIKEYLEIGLQALSQEPCDKCAMKNSNSDYCKNCTVIEYHGEKVSVPTKFVEKEPCNTVDREAILNKIKEVCFSKEWTQFRVENGSHGQRDYIIDYIEHLPPVTQKSNECDYATMIAHTDYEKVKEKGCNTCKHQLRFMCTDWEKCENKSKYEPQEQEYKTGYWIDESRDGKSAVCSECNTYNISYGKYCKWCGTRNYGYTWSN